MKQIRSREKQRGSRSFSLKRLLCESWPIRPRQPPAGVVHLDKTDVGSEIISGPGDDPNAIDQPNTPMTDSDAK